MCFGWGGGGEQTREIMGGELTSSKSSNSSWRKVYCLELFNFTTVLNQIFQSLSIGVQPITMVGHHW